MLETILVWYALKASIDALGWLHPGSWGGNPFCAGHYNLNLGAQEECHFLRFGRVNPHFCRFLPSGWWKSAPNRDVTVQHPQHKDVTWKWQPHVGGGGVAHGNVTVTPTTSLQESSFPPLASMMILLGNHSAQKLKGIVLKSCCFVSGHGKSMEQQLCCSKFRHKVILPKCCSCSPL